MNNYLIILDWYLPEASANGICVASIANELIKNGNNVYLLCFGNNKAISNQYIDGVSVFKINAVGEKNSLFDCSFLRKLSYYVKWVFPYKSPHYASKEIVSLLIKAGNEIIKDLSIDIVVSVYLPIESLIAAKRLKYLFPNIFFVAYMLDSLSGGFNPRFISRKYCIEKKIEWENTLLKSFDLIILMKASRSHHQNYILKSEWLSKSRYLDIPLFNPSNN